MSKAEGNANQKGTVIFILIKTYITPIAKTCFLSVGNVINFSCPGYMYNIHNDSSLSFLIMCSKMDDLLMTKMHPETNFI